MSANAGVAVWVVILCATFSLNNGQIHMQEGLSLVDGTATHGVLRLTYDGRSGLLCADGAVGREEGRVACRDLGLPAQYPSLRPVNVSDDVVFIGGHVRCMGDEIKMSDCRHDDWLIETSCPGRRAVSLTCQTDPCTPSPCQNGGQCQLTSSQLGFTCNCSDTWSGQLCAYDVNECLAQNGGCSDLCVNEDGGYSCGCPQQQLQLGPDNHTCIAPGEHVTCGSDVMELTLEKSHFPSLHREHLTLSDVGCGASDNVTHIILRAPLSACGTVSQQAGGAIVYSNVVHSKEEVVDGVITRVKDVEIPFRCVMTLTEIREVPVTVDTGELHFLLEGTGRHDVQLQLSKTEEFHPGQGQVSVYPGQEVHGQVTLTSVDPNLQVALSNCSATTSVLHNSTTTAPYAILTDGCAQDSTLLIRNATDPTHAHFTLQAFKFLDNSPQVVLHCDLALCDPADPTSVCAQGCVAASG